ncbi:MAG: serine/threonine protein kinase [Myxococcales bacterium]|nr:serine/threonine protein kinase [Myxococcales bacterium]
MREGPKQFLVFINQKVIGDVVSEDEILAAVPDWKKSTLDTYRKKHKLEKFIVPDGRKRFRVVMNGNVVTEAMINNALSQVTPKVLDLLPNEVVLGRKDSYHLIRQLGFGAVGMVWEARVQGSGERVAVKICDPRPDLLEPSVFANVADRFRRESRLGPRIQHPSIIRYLDDGDHKGMPFLVMELARHSLRDELSQTGRMTSSETAAIGRQIAVGLSWIHSQNCVHRDVKPPNILITDRGYVLGDLGILRWGQLNPRFTNAGTITRASIQLGSGSYMAPEQIEDAHGATAASDVYAFGITLFELLTGDVPTPHRAAAGQLGNPSDRAELNILITRMTNYRPEDRPSLVEVLDVLSGIRPAASG